MNLTIKFRLIATMGVMAVMLVIGGLMGAFGVNRSNTAIAEIYSNQLPSLEALTSARVTQLRARVILDRLISHPDAADKTQALQKIDEYLQRSDESWKKYLSLPMDPGEEVNLSTEVTKLRDRYLSEGLKPTLAALKAGNLEEADKLNTTKVIELYEPFADSVLKLDKLQFSSAGKLLSESQSAFKTFVWIDIIGVAAGLVAVFVSAYFLVIAISHPLTFVLEQFEAIGNGDLSKQIRAKSNDEMGQLLRDRKSVV